MLSQFIISSLLSVLAVGAHKLGPSDYRVTGFESEYDFKDGNGAIFIITATSLMH